jgi:hypothetical protein
VSAPDYADPLIGWRVWCVVATADGLRLGSVIHDERWPIGMELVAECRAEGRHEAPDEACTCGIHAAREPATVWSYLRGRDEPGTVARVLGRVLLWGRVVEHEGGWRASHALPLDLVATEPELARGLAAYA